jgi:hypothetical protein
MAVTLDEHQPRDMVESRNQQDLIKSSSLEEVKRRGKKKKKAIFIQINMPEGGVSKSA